VQKDLKKLHNEKLHILNYPPDIQIKADKTGAHAARITLMRNAYSILVGKS
jgi:hypothetical protein